MHAYYNPRKDNPIHVHFSREEAATLADEIEFLADDHVSVWNRADGTVLAFVDALRKVAKPVA